MPREWKALRFDRVLFAFSIASLLVFVFLPLWLIHVYESDLSAGSVKPSGEETAVGIAVVLRATIRRWLRVGSQSFLRTTLATYTRVSTRTLTRRLVKSVARVIAGMIFKGVYNSANPDGAINKAEARWPWLGLLVGYVALCLSFFGVLALLTDDDLAKVTNDGQLPVAIASLLAGVPLLVYALSLYLAGRYWGVQARFRTAIDGLLLQGYFTGAGSFLPLTTDFELEGNESKKYRVAAVGLATLYLFHYALFMLSQSFDSYALLFMGSLFLTYCFVHAFPIYPLEGYYLWKRSKLLWVCFWIPILVSFIGSLAQSFGVIL